MMLAFALYIRFEVVVLWGFSCGVWFVFKRWFNFCVAVCVAVCGVWLCVV